MKLSEQWLREWTDPQLNSEDLANQLTMAGHEVDAVVVEGESLDGVVVGEVISVEPHPNADRLTVCKAKYGEEEPVEVVCGAPNVSVGMKTPVALAGLRLPNGMKLRRSKIRGVVSHGMLCSASELGLGDDSDGIMELGDEAEPGQALVDYLGLPDTVFDLDLTPNRGDCFCVLGLARDIAALTGSPLKDPVVEPVTPDTDEVYPVALEHPEACPRFAGRVIRGIDPAAKSPAWLVERLRRAGIRAIYPVVDITNYVMLEFGQPLHSYDLDALTGTVRPRLAKDGEKLTLLDEREITLRGDTLVIADDSGAIGLAGIMGGLSTAVTEDTCNIFLEAAHFTKGPIAGQARSYAMHTDASLRFERGVDPQGNGRAIEEATRLLLSIAGGEAGPLHIESVEKFLPGRPPIELRKARLAMVLGAEVADDLVATILLRLGLKVEESSDGWKVVPPSHRFDLEIEEDLIEEVARLFGYDSIPETTANVPMALGTVSETRVELDQVASILVARGYQEVVTYSFIDAEINRKFTGSDSDLVLSNPISSEMSTMRGSLWPGMAAAAAANVARQQDRVRFFEIGKSFHGTQKEPIEVVRVAALALGTVVPEQWSVAAEEVEFFDIKSDLVAIMQSAGADVEFEFVVSEHPALISGQSGKIVRGNETVGFAGKLHPAVARSCGLTKPAVVFELDAEIAFAAAVPRAKEVSRFPAIRRDIAIVVDEKIPASELAQVAAAAAPHLIQQVTIFDVYQGAGIEAGLKSVALGLILQETSRTLTDDDADSAMDAAVRKLQHKYAAVLRD
jgi:phenylalanyl-tRNA synthetase beta chain